MKQKIAIYPGTFDPITNGHVNLVKRAVKIFDKVILAVAENGGKSPLLSHLQRIELAQQLLAPLGVDVCGFSCLAVELAKQRQANFIVRGIRTLADFEREQQMAVINHRLDPEIETVLLTSAQEYAAVSSRAVREIAAYGGDISSFVHPLVAAALMR